MFTHARLLALSTLAWAAVACGGESPGFAVHGVRVVVETDAPFAWSADFPERIESTMDAALRYWGGDWQRLEGMSIALTGDPYVSCGGSSSLGCYDGDIRLTTRDPGIGTFACVEQTVLVHEVGHAVIGDRLHEDARWMQLDPLQATLEGRTGYTAEGEVECVIWASVWRHPPGTP